MWSAALAARKVPTTHHAGCWRRAGGTARAKQTSQTDPAAYGPSELPPPRVFVGEVVVHLVDRSIYSGGLHGFARAWSCSSVIVVPAARPVSGLSRAWSQTIMATPARALPGSAPAARAPCWDGTNESIESIGSPPPSSNCPSNHLTHDPAVRTNKTQARRSEAASKPGSDDDEGDHQHQHRRQDQ